MVIKAGSGLTTVAERILAERLTPMTALLTLAGRYEQRAIMWKAHPEHHALKRRGDGWSFSQCLAFARAIARRQRRCFEGSVTIVA